MQVKINVRNSSSCASGASTPSSPPGLLSPMMATGNKSIPQKSINNLGGSSNKATTGHVGATTGTITNTVVLGHRSTTTAAMPMQIQSFTNV